jgi:hypothetical protein
MKISSTLMGAILKWISRSLIFLVSLSAGDAVFAQYPINTIYISTRNATGSTTYTAGGATGAANSNLTGYNYIMEFGLTVAGSANYQQVDSVVANGRTFVYQSATPVVQFRRVDNTSVTGKRVSLWYQRLAANNNLGSTSGGSGSGGTAQFVPDYTDVQETLFAGRTFNIGIDNVFQNATTTNNNNIERVDVVFPGGIKAADVTKAGFAVFDRGSDGTNDPFVIAAISGIDGSGNPTSYFTPVSVTITPVNPYGTGTSLVNKTAGTTTSTSLDYHILRKNATETPTPNMLKIMTPNITQNRNGVLLTFSQLGITSSSTKVYGYSLVEPPTTANPTVPTAAQMVNYTSFPTTTDLNIGGLDMVAVSGVVVSNDSYVVLAEKIGNFNAVLTNGKVRLNWELGVADDLKETVVERSNDGVNFFPILSFSAPSAGLQTAFDEQPLSGTNYYRLKLMGYDGAVAAYSTICKIDIGAAGLVSLNIYPNPVRNKRLTLDARGLKNEAYTITIFDMNSNLIMEQKLAGNPVLSKDLVLPGSIPAGVYSIQLADKDGNRVLVKTIMVQ